MVHLTKLALLSLIGAWTLVGIDVTKAQVSPEAEAGWQSDVEGLRHFNGLRCPDVIGAFYRIKVMEGDGVQFGWLHLYRPRRHYRGIANAPARLRTPRSSQFFTQL
jgi:hypothetical protein